MFSKKDIVRLWARRCDETLQGMNEGWVLCDDIYIKYEQDLDGYLIEWAKQDDLEYEDIEELKQKYYDDGLYYWTAWEEERDYAEMPNGSVVEYQSIK